MNRKIIVGLWGIFSLVTVSLANASTVFIDPATVPVGSLNVNDPLTLTVKGSDFPAAGVTSGSVIITWDAAVLTFVSWTPLGGFTSFFDSQTANSLEADLTQPPLSNAGSAFDFLSIDFTLAATDPSSVVVGLGGGGNWQLDDGTTVTNVIYEGAVINSPVPVPPAVWLFGSGLLGLVGIARRRQSRAA